MSVALWDGVLENARTIGAEGGVGLASGWRRAGRSARLRRKVAIVAAAVLWSSGATAGSGCDDIGGVVDSSFGSDQQFENRVEPRADWTFDVTGLNT
jgi:hypothetical protein